MEFPRYLKTGQAALRLGVSPSTIQNMVKRGALEAWTTDGGHLRIASESVDKMLAKRSDSIPGIKENDSELDILVTDDDPISQKLYQANFNKWNLSIKLRIASSGFDTLLCVGQRPPDILITDLRMPYIDGFEMIHRLRANPDLSHMEIIVVSAIDRREVIGRGLPKNIAIFEKPIPFHEIKGILLCRLGAELHTG